MSGDRRGRVLKGVCVMAMALGVGALAPALAQAVSMGSGNLSLAGSARVGQTGLPGEFRFTNASTDAQVNDAMTVCTGNGPAECGSQEIVLVPACTRENADLQCVAADLGVIRISPTASGRLGSACAGMAFTTRVVDPAIGSVAITPQPATAKLTLYRAGSVCDIDFTYDVLKMPTVDRNPQYPGVQWWSFGQSAWWFGSGAGGGGISSTSGTVTRGTPKLATEPSGPSTPGGRLTDTATVSERALPQPGGTVEYRLYAPDEATCSGPPVFTSVKDYPVAGGPVTSEPFTATQSGTYHWVVTYSGDANNEPATVACTAAGAAPDAAGETSGQDGPGSPGAESRARLTARFRSGAARSRHLRYEATPTIDGLLLDDDKHPIAGAQVAVQSRRREAGAATKPTASVKTASDGSFEYRLPAGPSRTVTFAYTPAGAESSAASASVQTLVRASLTTRITPRRPRVGRRIRLTGRLRYLPRAGVQVLIQAQDGRVWRPIGTAKSKADGSFSWHYRFNPRAAGKRFALRALVDSPIYAFTTGHSRAILVQVRP